MSVRMRDIADQLGLSISTVSLALRAAPQVAEETRMRVVDAAEQLGYTVRPRHHRPVLSHVAFITRDELGNDFYGAVLSGAESECRRLGLTLHFMQINDDSTIRQGNYLQADGLLVVGSIGESIVRQLKQLELPTVLVDNNLPFLHLDRILIENVHSMYRTTQYAYGCGHRAIAFLCGPITTSSFKERLIGYRAAIADLGLQPLELYFHDTDARDVVQTLHDQFQRYDQLTFTALIGCNDKATMRAFHALHDQGVHVPNEVSLLGFDDVDLASVIRPALTTNHVPRELLGRLGVQRLVERAREPGLPPLGLTIETTLIERDSVCQRS
jgi:DNA-binding LacI/PurR family transcriptional regulator